MSPCFIDLFAFFGILYMILKDRGVTMRICILVDHYPLPPRIKKLKKSFESIDNYEVVIFAWNRQNEVVSEDDVYTYNQNIKIGNQMQKLLNLPKLFVSFKRLLDSQSFDLLVSIDYEMFLICSLLKRDRKLIYEVYDIKFFANRWIDLFRRKSERWALKRKADGIIFASPFFQEYYKVNHIPFVTLNNKLSKEVFKNDDSEKMRKSLDEDTLDRGWTIGFIGLIRYEEILKNLLLACQQVKGVNVLLAGSGPQLESLQMFVVDHNMTNVSFTGRYELDDLADLYAQCNVIWAAYPNKDENVKYAISNKFFEAQVFRKPIIVSENTYLAKWVEGEHLGYVVDPYSQDCVIDLIKTISEGSKEIKLSNECLFWEDEQDELYRLLEAMGVQQ